MTAPALLAGDFGDEFDRIVEGFDRDLVEPVRFRVSRAAERREGREACDRGRGFRRHRTGEREV